MKTQNNRQITILSSVALFTTVILLIQYDPISADHSSSDTDENIFDRHVRANIARDESISTALMSAFNATNIRNNLRWLSSKVHVAGTDEQIAVMHQLAEQYRSYGLDVTTHEYQVLLSYPNYSQPNTIEVLPADGSTIRQISDGKSEPLGPKEALDQQTDPRGLVWWNAYSQTGSATAELVYANYGRPSDYALLDAHSVNISGRLVLARYGEIWRGTIVHEAANRGAVGVIIYSDPYDNSNNFTQPADTFPNTIYLPASGAQRGSLMETNGDPETEFYPSKPYTYRTANESQLRARKILPNIPVTPIGYRDAIKIFENMANGTLLSDWNSDWQGTMNVTYRLTSGFNKFRLNVNAITERRTITDVVAYFRGSTEPDRMVLVSNHVDAWVKGAIDPNSGTATLLEMARVLSSVANSTGWRPKRTIAFAQWDAEEYGLIGSAEWVEEFLKPLSKRAVALINIDNISGNLTLRATGVPLLYRTLVDAAQRVAKPNRDEIAANRRTLYDSWLYYSPNGPLVDDITVPHVSIPGGGSDYERFIAYVGIPVLDVGMTCYCFNIYHTMYEIPWAVENLIDTTFGSMNAVGQLTLEIARNIADSIVIPFDARDYGIMLAKYLRSLRSQIRSLGFNNAFVDHDAAFNGLEDAVRRLQMAANNIQQQVIAVNSGGSTASVRQVQMLNDRLMSFERAFIDDYGVYDERSFYRHLVFSSSVHDDYSGETFAAIIDPVVNWNQSINVNSTAEQYWRTTAILGFTKVRYAIESAILVLDLNGYQ